MRNDIYRCFGLVMASGIEQNTKIDAILSDICIGAKSKKKMPMLFIDIIINLSIEIVLGK